MKVKEQEQRAEKVKAALKNEESELAKAIKKDEGF